MDNVKRKPGRPCVEKRAEYRNIAVRTDICGLLDDAKDKLADACSIRAKDVTYTHLLTFLLNKYLES